MKIINTKDVTTGRFIGLIVGRSGSGKTFQAKLLPNPSEVLVVSAESGLLCLKGTNIDVAEVKSMEDLRDVYTMLAKGSKYKTIFIDSITEIAEVCLSDLKHSKEFSDRKMALAMYGEYNDQLTIMIKAFRDLNQYSVIMTCLTAEVQDGLEIKRELNVPGTKIKNNLKSWMDICLCLEVKEVDGVKQRYFVTDDMISPLAKDRSGMLDKYEEANIGKVMARVLA